MKYENRTFLFKNVFSLAVTMATCVCVTVATRAGPYQPVHSQPAPVHDRDQPGGDVQPVWSGHLHAYTARQSGPQQRRWLCTHGVQGKV